MQLAQDMLVALDCKLSYARGCTLDVQVELNKQGLSSLVPPSKAPHVRAGEQTDSVVLNVQRMHRQVSWQHLSRQLHSQLLRIADTVDIGCQYCAQLCGCPCFHPCNRCLKGVYPL
jgi:hypothetical protein